MAHVDEYDNGMIAMAGDPLYDGNWRDWIVKMRLRLGSTDFADIIYYRSEHYVNEKRRLTGHRPRALASVPAPLAWLRRAW